MKAHIVGGGFGGLVAAAYLIRNAGMSGQDITICEASEQLGGAFPLAGSAATSYILPTGALFDAEFRCTFDLLATIPSVDDPAISVKDDFFAFNKRYPFHDRAHIIDRDGHVVHSAHFGLSVRDRFDLVRLALTPETMLDGRRIEEFFSPTSSPPNSGPPHRPSIRASTIQRRCSPR
jgi:oleate hydratase